MGHSPCRGLGQSPDNKKKVTEKWQQKKEDSERVLI